MMTDFNDPILVEIFGLYRAVRCYYATVLFTAEHVWVFENEAGGMCPIIPELLRAVYPLPDELKSVLAV